jgi:hypothetical protein
VIKPSDSGNAHRIGLLRLVAFKPIALSQLTAVNSGNSEMPLSIGRRSYVHEDSANNMQKPPVESDRQILYDRLLLYVRRNGFALCATPLRIAHTESEPNYLPMRCVSNWRADFCVEDAVAVANARLRILRLRSGTTVLF